jgi:hypothetical protein
VMLRVFGPTSSSWGLPWTKRAVFSTGHTFARA